MKEDIIRECYLGFLFHGKTENEDAGLHVTHVYLGHLNKAYVNLIKTMVDDYFGFYGKQRVFPVHFNIQGEFGGKTHLACETTKAFNGLSVLRGQFISGGFHKSRYLKFTPHVSTHKYPGLKEIKEPIKFYSLVADGKIIHEWSVSGD